MKIGSLFTGYGGLDMAVEMAVGGDVAWVCDNDRGAAKILAHRYPHLPNLGDVTAVDWTTVQSVDVLTAGFPCQPVSHAGKRKGTDDERWLFDEVCRALRDLDPSPRLCLFENVAGLLSANRGDAMARVVGGLAESGYVGRWRTVRAADIGAPHRRERVFIVANPAGGAGLGSLPWAGVGKVPHGDGEGVAHAEGDQGRIGDRDSGVAPHADLFGHQRDGQAWDGWSGSENGGRAAADPKGDGRDERRPEPARLIGGHDAPQRGAAPAHAGGERHGRGQDGAGVGRVDRDHESETRQRERPRPVAGDRGATATPDAERGGWDGRAPEPIRGPLGRVAACGGSGVDWGPYAPAIHRWERAIGRPAPAPTEPGRTGQPRLSPAFVEWMMGLDAGWVTDVPGLSRNDQLKALGNGVVPQQAATALALLLTEQVAA